MKNLPLAIAFLVGTTIGAGIFAIPHVISQAGLPIGLVYLLGLGILNLLLNLLYGEVILRTPGDHQLTGYAEIYLGKKGKAIATTAMFISLYGALLAYLLKIGQFCALVFGFANPLFFSLLFFTFASLAIILGLKTISQIEIILSASIITLIGIIAFLAKNSFVFSNYPLNPANFSSIFLPYGVILFALSGSAAIPEMEEILRQDHKNLKKAILFGSLIPLIAYLIFALSIVGVSGMKTSDDAISSLVGILPNWITKVGASLGILTMSTSFLSLGYVLREVYHRDFKLPKPLALFLACVPALALLLAGAKNFIQILEITGAFSGGLTGILIILLYGRLNLRKIPPAILWLLGLVFGLGLLSPLF